MSTQIETEIAALEVRGYAKLERWERQRLADLRIQLKQSTPEYQAAQRAAEAKQRSRVNARIRRGVIDLANAMPDAEGREGIFAIARQHKIL